MAENNQVQISLRLSKELHEQLTDYARRVNQSLNSVAIQGIQRMIEDDELKQRVLRLEEAVEKINRSQ